MGFAQVIKKVFTVDWKSLLPLIRQAKRSTGRSYYDLCSDIKRCNNAGFNWGEYFVFGFQHNTDSEYRKSFVCNLPHYREIADYFDTESKDFSIIEDKGMFNKKFDAFRTVKSLDLRSASFDEFSEFVDTHEIMWAKNPLGYGGSSVFRLKREELQSKSLKKSYEDLISKELFVLEGNIVQHPEMSKLSLNSVNTIRVMTIRDKQGNITTPFAASRIATDDCDKDNCSLKGANCILDERGVVNYPYFRIYPDIKEFSENQFTGFKLIGFQVPYFEEALEICKKALELTDFNFIGWDVAITENGPCLIEANRAASFDFFQSYTQLQNGQGKKKELEKYLGFELSERDI